MSTVYPWEREGAPTYVQIRQPKMEIAATPGVREDLPRRRPPDELAPIMRDQSFGVVIMSHRGYANGRLSVCLSSIPGNVPVTVCSDAIAACDVTGDRAVAEAHGAAFHHATPWAGRAGNAIACMRATNWTWTLFLCDDVWLFPETCADMLRWGITLQQHGVPLAALAAPRFETYHEHKEYGFDSWAQCLQQPWRFEAFAPPPGFRKTPALYTNPFGACMLMYRPAYGDLGGFAPEYWAHDDVYNHKVWTSGRWVNACYPGRGFVHLGAQSWHEGETEEWVGQFANATGMTAEESGKRQAEAKMTWAPKLATIFESLGGQAAV